MKHFTSVVRKGNKVLHRGYENGKRVQEKVEYRPRLWTPAKKPTDWKDMQCNYVDEHVFDSMYDASDFAKRYADIEDYRIFGNQTYHIAALHDWYPGKIEYDPNQIRVLFFDIETENVSSDENRGFVKPIDATNEVTLISCYDSVNRDMVTFGIVDCKAKENETYYRFGSEREMLVSFIGYLRARDFDVFCGWNINTYDIPYLINRGRMICGEDLIKKISPWGLIEERMIKISNNEVQTYKVLGIEILDYMDVFKKFGYTYGQQSSYKLDHIADVVLGERKLDYSEYGSLKQLLLNNPQKYYDYCVRDTLLVKQMEDKLRFLQTVYSLAYRMKVNFVDTLGTVAPWDSYIYGTLLSRNIVVPPTTYKSADGVDGAWVMEVEPHLNGWLGTLDYASLYPNVMISFNISPETMDDRLPGITATGILQNGLPEIPEGLCLTGAGQLFRTDKQGIIPELVAGLFAERKVIKKQMLEKKQLLNDVKKRLEEMNGSN